MKGRGALGFLKFDQQAHGTRSKVIRILVKNSIRRQAFPVKFASLQFCELFNWAGRRWASGKKIKD
jgi:hypothetical protein